MPPALCFTRIRNIGAASEQSEAALSLVPASVPARSYSGEILQT